MKMLYNVIYFGTFSARVCSFIFIMLPYNAISLNNSYLSEKSHKVYRTLRHKCVEIQPEYVLPITKLKGLQSGKEKTRTSTL